MQLTGRTALVTGASRGIGRTIALALAEEGADVAVNYVSSEGLARDVVDQIHKIGHKAVLAQTDVADYADTYRMAQDVLIGTDVRKQLDSDLALEMAALRVLREGIGICQEAEDHATRDLVERLIVDEEEHVDWIEAQVHQIKELGYEHYLAQQISGEEN